MAVGVGMKQRQAFKFELIPNDEQIGVMRCFAGACRFVYNKTLIHHQNCYQTDTSISFSDTN
jgi:putative transposase